MGDAGCPPEGRFLPGDAMRRVLGVICVALLAAAPPQRGGDDVDPEPSTNPKAALRAIQGTWKVVKLEHNGKANKGPFREGFWVFKGKEITLRNESGKEWFKGTFVLDLDQKTKTIDITWADGERKGKTQKGIYKIEKDTLTLSRGTDGRPKGFTDAGKVGKPGLLTLERVKPE
jgi:uncharacterized protein (TIGR03067 family)